MATDLTQFSVKTVDQFRTDYLRTYSNELQRRGVSNPNVSFGAEIYSRGQAISVLAGVIVANLPIQADAQMPDSAQGADLLRQGKVYKLAPKDPGGSTGPLIFASSGAGPSLVVVGQPLEDVFGQSYKVAIGGLYNDQDPIPIESISTGSATNLAEGSALRWVTPPAFAQSVSFVGAGGFAGGTDAEDQEAFRARLLDRIRNPPGGGNAAQVAGWAEGAATSAIKAFVYPCITGGASLQLCVCQAPTLTNKSRVVNALVRLSVILPALISQIPEFAAVTLTTSKDVPLDVSMGLALPLATTAGGPGGGWVDASPWPVFASSGFAAVTAATNSTSFSVNADFAPTPGVTRICWLSPFEWKLYFATVVTSSGTGPYAITIDKPFVGIATGQFISPQAERSDVYFNTLLGFFAGMGPGEVTNIVGLLPRVLRKPLISSSLFPSEPAASMLHAVESAGREVLDTSYLYRSATTQALPANPATGPNIFVPQRLGFYPST